MGKKTIIYPIVDRWSYVWLLLSMALGTISVSIGNWVLPVAAWLSAVFALRFMHTQKRVWLAYLLLALATAVSAAIALPPELASIRIAIVIGAAIFANLPPLADRLLGPRLPGFVSTLVFPCAYTALEYINTMTSPTSSFGVQAYTQFDNLPLMQLVSITGLWGLSFLMSWFASVVNYAWDREFEWRVIRRGVLAYLGIMLAVLLFGQTRLWLAPTPEDTVRMVGITAVDFRANQSELMQAVNNDPQAFRRMSQERQDLYFEKTIEEAQGGAELILWPENAIPLPPEDVPALMARAGEVARQEGIYLGVSMMVLPQDEVTPYEIKMRVLDPNGEQVLEHIKFGGAALDGGNRLSGDGILETAVTPFGTLASVICFDTNVPNKVIQTGQKGADILLSPSLEFAGINPMHAHMATFRAVENGVSVFRIADNGLSIAVDPYGRTLAVMDHFTPNGEQVLVAQVPTQGTTTIYPLIGDLVAWLSIIGFVVLTIAAIVRRRQEKAVQVTPEDLAPAH